MHTVFDPQGHWIGDYDEYGQPLQQAIWLGDLPVGLVARIDGVDRLFYIEPDALGSPRVVIDPTRDAANGGTAVWRWPLTGDAFGEEAPYEDPDGDGAAFVLDLRFPGQQYDSATGFNYNYFRDYDPSVGRYSQSDPIGLVGGVSTYGYAGGRPLGRIDALGLKDYTACETRAELNKVFLQLNKIPQIPYNFWRMGTVFWNHSSGGKFDYKIRQPDDTFLINGARVSAASFGNFSAGYMAVTSSQNQVRAELENSAFC